MGLLDDAIREHLELKRLRGADPGLVSREESDVFGPVRGGEPEADGGDGGVREPPSRGNAPPVEHHPARSEGFSHVGQETAEIDMQTVLEGESGGDMAPAGPVAAAPVAATPRSDNASQEGQPVDDSLEWEVPGGPANASDRDDLAGGAAQEDPVEDVLEETPEFLRDTPEQERLWFEQRPPRDFDFDK
jgi:hypothetical protein